MKPYTRDSVSKEVETSHKRVSKHTSKHTTKLLTKLNKTENSSIPTEKDPQLIVEGDKDEMERRAIDYLKDLSEMEGSNASFFEEGLRNFCSTDLNQDQVVKKKAIKSQYSRHNSISKIPRRNELTGSLVFSSGVKSPSMRRNLEDLETSRDERPSTKDESRKEVGEGDKATENMTGITMRTIGPKSNIEGGNQKANMTSGDKQTNIARMTHNFKTNQSFWKDTKSRLQDGLIGRSLSMPRLEYQGNSTLFLRQSVCLEEVPATIHSMYNSQVLGKKDKKDSSATKPDGSKQSLQNIVKTALLAQGHTKDIIPSRESPQKNLVREIRVAAMSKLWNPKRESGETKHKYLRSQMMKGTTKWPTRPWSVELSRMNEDRDQASRDEESVKIQPHTSYQSEWVNKKKTESQEPPAGIKGKSVIIMRFSNDKGQNKKVNGSIEEIEEKQLVRSASGEIRHDHNDCKSGLESPSVTITRFPPQAEFLKTPNQRFLSKSLFNKLKKYPGGINNIKNIGNLTTRLTSHNEMLNGVSMSKEFNDSKLATAENPLNPTPNESSSYKARKHNYLKKGIKRFNSSASLLKGQSVSSVFALNMKTKPFIMSLYSWDSSFIKDWEKYSIV